MATIKLFLEVSDEWKVEKSTRNNRKKGMESTVGPSEFSQLLFEFLNFRIEESQISADGWDVEFPRKAHVYPMTFLPKNSEGSGFEDRTDIQ